MFAMKCADSHGDYERIYMGVHENFPMPYNDPRCIKTCGVLDWLGFHDKLQRRIDESQHSSFSGTCQLQQPRCTFYVLLIHGIAWSSHVR